MEIIQLLIAAGVGGMIGSLLTTFFQEWLSQKSHRASRNFQEKKEAYIGYMEAGFDSEIIGTYASATRWSYWEARCHLVASPKVAKVLRKMRETNPVNGNVHPDRLAVFSELTDAMREDLAVDARSLQLKQNP